MIPKSELQDKITESSSSRRTWIEMYTLHRQKALTASSSSSWRTWIEISAGRSNSLNSLVVLLAEDVDRNVCYGAACAQKLMSSSSRRTWIEMKTPPTSWRGSMRRPPRGGRG